MYKASMEPNLTSKLHTALFLHLFIDRHYQKTFSIEKKKKKPTPYVWLKSFKITSVVVKFKLPRKENT